MGDVIKNWKNRFFVIDKNVLYYYEDDKAFKVTLTPMSLSHLMVALVV
jgi:hypothetical protein